MSDFKKDELEVLRILWAEPDLKPADIQQRFHRAIENATLRSVLRALVSAGKLNRKKRGKAYHYRALVSKQGVLSSMANRMAQVFADGSTADFIAALVRAEKLSPEEVDELKRVAEGAADSEFQEGSRDE